MHFIYSILIASLSFTTCNPLTSQSDGKSDQKHESKDLTGLSKAYFASGCFWCVEAIFESVEGVEEAVSGYAGGSKETANYRDVSAGRSDHAESVEVYYDPALVSYETLLKVFFGSHDPTTLNRQGPDAGTQYRSEIFYQTNEEKQAIATYVQSLYDEKIFKPGSITTLVSPLEEFYDAEGYHQDFERKNPNQGYVRAVSIPRLKKFQKKYPQLLKKNQH